MDDRRTNLRMRRLKEGRLVFNGKKSLMSCMVRDATASGARLLIGEPYLVPPLFHVSIAGEAQDRPAERIWMRENEMGIRFRA
jgi:hypothetical protein